MKPITVALLLFAGCHYRQYAGQPPPPPSSAPDPPGRVARLSYLEGPVSFRAEGTGEWVAASLNRPITTGDYLWTDRSARAELSIGSTVLRLDSRTGIGILNLDDRVLQVKLSEGVLQAGVRDLDADETIEIDTPSSSVTLQRTGDYRVEANPASPSARVIVRAGVAEVAGEGSPAFLVRANQDAAPDIRPAPPLDAFDQFCLMRERRTERAESLQHLPRGVIGWEDLDEYGYWRPHPTYGPVWHPRVIAPGWAPYRFGHWVWIEPWGWTWVDEAPWGFAPFHYGRWILFETRWCWVPGPPRVRVVYAPALVVFVGGGRPGLRLHVSVGVGIGVGWFPLGPHEVYIPPYRASRGYIANVNISHTVIRNTQDIHRVDVSRQTYLNRRIAGAVTIAPEDAFAGGRTISRAGRAASDREAASYGIGGAAAPVAPNNRSLARNSEERGQAPRPPDSMDRRKVVVRRDPPPSQPPFEQRRPALERDPGRPPAASPQERRSEDRSRQQVDRRRETIEREHRTQPPAAQPQQQQQQQRDKAAPARGPDTGGRETRRKE